MKPSEKGQTIPAANLQVLLCHSVAFALVFLLSLSVAAAPLDTSTLTRAEQGRVYDEAVHILGGNANVISRWQGDIQYHIIGTDWFRRQAEKTFQEISELAGLPVLSAGVEPDAAGAYLSLLERTPPVQISSCNTFTHHRQNSQVGKPCTNFVVVQTSHALMQQIARAIPLRRVYQRSLGAAETVSCFFAPFVGTRQVIHQAFIYVNEELERDMLKTCLQEEIYQSLGLFNDVTGSVYFSFNNKVLPKAITGYDRQLLKTVYDPDFAPGTPVFTVLQRFMDDLDIDPFNDQP